MRKLVVLLVGFFLVLIGSQSLAIAQTVSARIDGYYPNDPNNPVSVVVGTPLLLRVTITNTGNTAWKFIAGATIWDSNGKQVANYSKTLDSALQPGQQTAVSWSHTVNQVGDYWLQFGIWKNGQTLLDKKPSPSQRLIKGIAPPTISARIDSYFPYDPNNPVQVRIGSSTTISVTFTNTGNTAWNFIAGATVWDSNGNQVANYSRALSSALQPGRQTTVSWTHAVNQVGDYWLQFGVWKDGSTLLDRKPSPSQRLIRGIPACTYSIFPLSQSFSSAGGTGSVNVTAPSGCPWTATTSNTSWITITSGSSGSGNGTVNYSVASNSSTSSRTGMLTIAGQIFTVTQDGIPIPPPQTFSISGQVTSGGSGLSGVTMTLSGAASKTTTTDSNGNYSFTGLSNGNYTVTPSKSGCTFSPASRSLTVSGSNVTGQNFTATCASNRPPIINSLTANPPTVSPNSTSSIKVSASDPENDPLTYTWSASCGTLSSTTGPGDKTWTAPSTPGTCRVTVSVTDNKPGHSPVSRFVDILVVASTETPILTVKKAGTGSGTVTSSPAGINCGSDCSEAYASGTSVTLTATAAAGSTFAGWSGACSGTGSCVVTMNSNKTVTATFNSTATAVTLTLYVHEASYKKRLEGKVLPGVTVVARDGAGNSFTGTTNSLGFVRISGIPGKWTLMASRDDYNARTWESDITQTTVTLHAFLFPKKITAAMDVDLLNLIDRLAPQYYDSNDKDGPKWALSLEQYKAWIVTIATCEGSKGGYAAHSGALGADMFQHQSLSSFKFSTGIGPFQLDNGGIDKWDTWPTIKKLGAEQYAEEPVKTVLKEHFETFKNKPGVTLQKLQERFSRTWYGVQLFADSDNGDVEACWNMSTGTDWIDHSQDGTRKLDWEDVKSKLAGNAKGQPGWDKSLNIVAMGNVQWDIKKEDGYTTDNPARPVEFAGCYPTWKITSRKWDGTVRFSYFYTYANDVEVWVLDQSDVKYAFFREYKADQYPENRSGNTAGVVLKRKAFASSVEISSSPISVTYSPTASTPSYRTIRVTVTNKSGAKQKVMSIVPQAGEPFTIRYTSPSLPLEIPNGTSRTIYVYTQRGAGQGSATATAPYFAVTLDNWACGAVIAAGEPGLPHLPDLWDVRTEVHAGQLNVAVVGPEPVESVQLELFDLSGRKLVSQTSTGSVLTTPIAMSTGQPLANGVYLYVVRARSLTGELYVSEVRKLVILR